ncbi:MAG: OmpA family protein [Alkalispirochaeta sp.]
MTEFTRFIEDTLQTVNRPVEIVGHTADIGTQQSQLTLSTQRAEAVREYLVELGIPEQNLSATGVGGSRPIVTGSDSEALRRNRRVEFRVGNE